MRCPICNNKAELLFDAGHHPVSLVDLCDTAEESINLSVHHMEMHVCKNCMHVYNNSFNPHNIKYSDGCHMYNNGSKWQQHVNKVKNIIEIEYNDVDAILEIGAGDCSFLKSLRVHAHIYAVDPSEEVKQDGVRYKQKMFEPGDIPKEKSILIVMRHLLEHMEDPRGFVEDILEIARERNQEVYFLIEVPCCEEAIECTRIEDWTYEHPQNFTHNSLSIIMDLIGTHEITFEYGGEVLLATGAVNKSSLERRIDYIIDKYRKIELGLVKSGSWLKSNDVVFWGGAGKSATFLNIFGAPDTAVVVDSDKNKHGFFVPRTRIQIKDPEILYSMEPKYIVVTTSWRANDIYEEIKKKQIPYIDVLKFEEGEFTKVSNG